MPQVQTRHALPPPPLYRLPACIGGCSSAIPRLAPTWSAALGCAPLIAAFMLKEDALPSPAPSAASTSAALALAPPPPPSPFITAPRSPSPPPLRLQLPCCCCCCCRSAAVSCFRGGTNAANASGYSSASPHTPAPPLLPAPDPPDAPAAACLGERASNQ